MTEEFLIEARPSRLRGARARGGGHWVVLANWYGEMRLVFSGTIWECCAYKREST